MLSEAERELFPEDGTIFHQYFPGDVRCARSLAMRLASY